MFRSWRIAVALSVLALAGGSGTAAFMRGQLTSPYLVSPIQRPVNNCALAPSGTSLICQTCLRTFCATMSTEKAQSICKNYCVSVTPANSSIPTSTVSSRGLSSISRSISPIRSSTRSTSPVCGNAICEETETQYCPRDCPSVSSVSSSSSFSNPLNLSCSGYPSQNGIAGLDGCAACLNALCPLFPEAQAITYCSTTCSIIRGSSSNSSGRSSTSSGQQSSNAQPGGFYIEIPTSNAQMFSTAGEGWVPYGISRMHKNTIAANDAQATARWEAQLPFAEYAFYMYLPQSKEVAEQYLMDTVPLYVNLNAANFSMTINQRNASPAFSQTIGGVGPETVQHNWYYLGTLKPVATNGIEQAQSIRITLPTGRASDSTKKASDGWVAAGDLRIYYKTPGIVCGDGKCHDSERTSCPVDCTDVPECGNGYCDINKGESLKTCVQDCGATGVCGNLRCEGWNNETPGNCPTDCQYGTTGGEGGNTGGVESSARSSAASSTVNGLFCGDGKCSADIGETQENCSKDCGSRSSLSQKSVSSVQAARCGNGICEYEKGESTTNCSADCGGGAACGNGICEKDRNETAENCPKDCGDTNPTCGNYLCDKGETYLTCPKDCGSYCGDGICNKSNETIDSCERDCGFKSSTSSLKSTSSVTSKIPNVCGDRICSPDEKDAFRFAMEGGLLCVEDCPGILKAGCTLTDPYGTTCTDSDCGVQPYIVGNVSYSKNVDASPLKDFCVGTSAVAETVCVADPYENNALAVQFFYTIDCPNGCLNGACKQSAAASTFDSAPVKEIAPVSPPSSIPAVPDTPEQPQAPTNPTCDNRSNAGTTCNLCLSAFCPFSPSRAEWLCSVYCVSPNLSGSVSEFSSTPTESTESMAVIPVETDKKVGFWDWLTHLTASIFGFESVADTSTGMHLYEVPM